MIQFGSRRLELKYTWTISRNSSDYKENIFITLERDGIRGYGEAAPNTRYGEDGEKTASRLDSIRETVESYDWLHYRDVKIAVDQIILDQSCARCALDVALMDWVGKKLGLPLYRLFGLDKSKVPHTSFSIGIDSPEAIRTKVGEAKSYPVLKVKLGSDRDDEIIEAVRAVTGKPLRIDANEGWKTREEALDKIRWLQGVGVELIEQPMPAEQIEDARWLRRRVDLPIVADESVKTAADIPRLAGAYDGINIKLMKAGGIQPAWTMIQMAREMRLKIMLGCMIESSVAIAAAAHLAPLADWVDLDGNLLISNDPFTGIEAINGKILLNDRSGLGVQPAAESA
ncbi:MAG: dipeptide epimerase [Acidobacteriota bacterium]